MMSASDNNENAFKEQPNTVQVQRRRKRKVEKRFECDFCEKKFGYKQVLQNHRRVHTGERPFKCRVCNFAFSRDHHLKSHELLHTGEKPYKCAICQKTFRQVANLRRHDKSCGTASTKNAEQASSGPAPNMMGAAPDAIHPLMAAMLQSLPAFPVAYYYPSMMDMMQFMSHFINLQTQMRDVPEDISMKRNDD